MSAARARRAVWLLAALTAAALVVRLIDLGARPFHHDESQDAYFSWFFRTTGDYEYQPILHGPLRFYLTALMYVLFGDHDWTARLAPVLMGTAMVPLPWLLRKQLGTLAAISASVLLAFGPSYLYFSRFAREDIYFAALTLALIVAIFRFLDRPTWYGPAIIGALVAASFATKETTFISVFVGGSFLIVAFAFQARRDGLREGSIWRAVAAPGRRAWLGCLAAFLFVFAVLFTTFFTHLGGFKAGVVDGIDYWLDQQPVGRGGEVWWHYVTILVGEEWPVLLLGLVGAWVSFRNPTLLRMFLIWGFVVSMVIYSWASEKFAWLILHPLLPLILLAGIGVQEIWRARNGWAGRLGLALVVLGAAYSVFSSWTVNVEHRADPRELLVTTQTSEEVLGVRNEVDRLAARAKAQGKPFSVIIDSSEGATFPYAWYFRHLSVGYLDFSQGAPPMPSGTSVAVLTPDSYERLKASLKGWNARQFDFRVWWVRDYHDLTFGSAMRWLFERRPWNEMGGLPEYLVRAPGV